MVLFLPLGILKILLPLLAVIAGIFVITTKNAIISVFNLIVLYILVAFYLIYMGITYMGISYIIIYIGAIAILFLFVIMMIDIEVVEKRNNNYLPLLFLLLSGFFLTLKNILYNIGIIKMKSLSFKEENFLINNESQELFYWNNLNTDFIFICGIGDIYINNLDNDIKVDNKRILMPKDEDKVEINISDSDFKFTDYLDSDSIYIQPRNNESKNVKSELNVLLSQYNPITRTYDFEDKMILKSDILISDNKKDSEISKDKDFLINNNIISEILEEKSFAILNSEIWIDNSLSPKYNVELENNNYLLIIPDWESALSRVTQISAIGDVLYTVYHSYIYILSVLLLLGMIGAIILTTDNNHEIRTINILPRSNTKKSSFLSIDNSIFIFVKILIIKLRIIFFLFWYRICNKNIFSNKEVLIFEELAVLLLLYFKESQDKYKGKNKYSDIGIYTKIIRKQGINKTLKKGKSTFPLFLFLESDILHYEGIIGNLFYFIVANIIIALLLLLINSYFSLSVKYLEKGGGFECGFTSFVQTRERFNVIFYRVSLLFLVFDLEIILAFPYTAIYQKNQNISKNNVLAFLYILIVGFIYELKEGALNIVKKAHST
jgi:NADH-ubiquinone oxidoreductase chain 6